MKLEVLNDLKSLYNVDYTYVDKEIIENSSLVNKESIADINEMMNIVGRNLSLDMLKLSSFIVYYNKMTNTLYEFKNRLDSPINKSPYDIINHLKKERSFIIKKSSMNRIDFRTLKNELMLDSSNNLTVFLID